MIQYEQLTKKLLHEPHRWLVTGVAGFIGSNLLEELLKLNQMVIGIDNFATGSTDNLENVLAAVSSSQQKNFHFYEGDICQLNDCQKVLDKVEFVLHQAALGSVPRSVKTPEITHETNATGFLNMLIAAKTAGVKRFVYASSSSVYGDSKTLPKQEATIGNPLSPYAVSKYTNELYASAFATCYGLTTIGLRYFNVFGPRQDPYGPYAAVIPLWIAALLQNQTVYINGDGETSRDFCYIDNAVQANILAAMTQNNVALNTVYNIAVGEQNTLKKLYETMAEIVGIAKNENVVYRDFRPGDIRHSLADITKAKDLLGYTPNKKLIDGLKLTVSWFENNNRAAVVLSKERQC